MTKKYTLLLILLVLSACDNSPINSNKKNIDPQVNSIQNFSKTFPGQYVNLPRIDGGACAFDAISTNKDELTISGWSVIAAKEGVMAEEIILGIVLSEDEVFTIPSKLKRGDVADYFNNKNLLESGFFVTLKKSELPGGARLRLYQVYQGKVYICPVNGNV